MRGPLITSTLDALAKLVGSEVGRSGWVLLDQPMVDTFGALTRDQNPMHVDPAAAARSPFGGTIVHGFFTLSMVAAMAYEACPGIPGTTVNYGFDRIRFVSPVLVGSRTRGIFKLAKLDLEPSGNWKAWYDVTVEVDGQGAPALVASWIMAGIGPA